jgi:molybdate transport system regulatory protein
MPKPFATFPSLSIRIDLSEGRIGPGKIRLLEAIRDCGSLAAAGRSMGMTFRRAQDLVKEIETIYTAPAVQRHAGGGGGTTLTPLGLSLVASYREIERQAESVAREELLALLTEIAEPQDATEKAS